MPHPPLLHDLTLTELAAAIRNRSVSATQAVEATLASINALDPLLNAFCTRDVDGARRSAAHIDRRLAQGEAIGPLAGVPVAIKDLICTRGLRTTFGSKLYADHVPDEDDVVVERGFDGLRRADAAVANGSGQFGQREVV